MRIKSIIGVGIILIILGIVSFAIPGIPYTSRENVIDAGSIRTSADTQKTIPDVTAVDRVANCEWRRARRLWLENLVLGF